MPRISMWKPNKGKDYEFIDRTSAESIQIGGLGVLVHKYIGPTIDGDVTDIDDVLFLENRNRRYDDVLVEMRGTYQPQDVDYDLSQFGIFLSSDTLRIDFHFNDMMDVLGRKLMSGDVLEFPNMRDTDLKGVSINHYYVVQDALYSASGVGTGWYPHIWKVRAKKLPASEEYRDIINKASTNDTFAGEDAGTGIMPPGWATTVDANGNPGFGCDPRIYQALDKYCDYIGITDEIIEEARDNVFYDPRFFEIPHIYIVMDDQGHPQAKWWGGGDGVPPNGAALRGMGTSFPDDMKDGEYFLRVDYDPDRLFQKQGSRYVRISDDLRKIWLPMNRRLETYIDNIEITTLEDGSQVREKQSITKVIPQRKDQYAEHREETLSNEEQRQKIAKRLDGAE